MKRRAQSAILAAVDLGSNSFHLVVARHIHGQLIVIDRLREAVRLGAGLDADGNLDPKVAVRALDCLARFGQRLRSMHARNVRAVGTSALRQARDKRRFLAHARRVLGHPIEVVSGVEEARLIYAGVAQGLGADSQRRLVVDIGGGSTEAIVGRGREALELASVKLGCVQLTERFFGDGRITAKRLRRARIAVRAELAPVASQLLRRGWKTAYGASGTVRATLEAIRELDARAHAITPAGIARVLALLEQAGDVRELMLTSLTADRRAVFAGGAVILAEVLAILKIKRMLVAEGALRDGLLLDLLGRLTHEDARERSVMSMQHRYHVDLKQAARVEHIAVQLLRSVRKRWQLATSEAELNLRWAARLHEVGLTVAHSGYHRHGAYLLEHADMPGFTHEEQRLLARLVGAQRRRLDMAGIDELLAPWDRLAPLMLLLLRLAVLIHRGRGDGPQPRLALKARGRTLQLQISSRWLQSHPLTLADLREEVQQLLEAGIRLKIYSGRTPVAA